MFARVIENWLDSAGERHGYEIAFSQALVAEGHRIVLRSTHGQLEQGKDLITVDRSGAYHAYQLKAGDLAIAEWREIQGEVVDLVEVPLAHPNVDPATPFTPYLVISGRLSAPAAQLIRDRNTGWQQRGYPALHPIDRNELLDLLQRAHAEILPTTPADFERFLRLYLADKRDVLDKALFAEFLEATLPIGQTIRRSELRRTLAGTAVLATYVLSGYSKTGNHLALLEGWALVFSHLLALLETHPKYLDFCRPSLQICLEAWEAAALALTREALRAPRWIEGHPIPDYAVRGWRTNVLLGYLCTFALYRRRQGAPLPEEGEILTQVLRRLKHGFLWGESAGPLYYAMILFLWSHGQEAVATQLTAELARIIASASQRGEMGFPDPYYDGPSLLKQFRLGETALRPLQSFRGRSFLLRTLIEFLARRGRKQTLKALWYDVCEVDSTELTLDEKVDLYRWHAKTGSLDSRRWPHPQDWRELVKTAEAVVAADHLLTSSFPEFLLPFLLVYPHRMTPAFARFLEQTLA